MCGSYTTQTIYTKAADFQAGLPEAARELDFIFAPRGVSLNHPVVSQVMTVLTSSVADILDEFAYNAPPNEAAAQQIHDAIQQVAGAVLAVVETEPPKSEQSEDEDFSEDEEESDEFFVEGDEY